jgi:putative iron-dependent peroxidase
VPGLRHAPAFTGPGVTVPSTPDALWIWLRGTDRGDLLHRGRALSQSIDDAFVLVSAIDSFVHDIGRDLSGYEDGTENPKGEAAREAAFSTEGGPGLAGSSFVAVQRWEHDLPRFEKLTEDERDASVGRRRADNEELPDAPASAHVKRTVQESFEPAAFLLRRSMPYVDGLTAGLNFVAFGKSFDAFEAQMKRMVGLEDGIADALFRFTRPLTSSYLWCPPLRADKLDLRAIGL